MADTKITALTALTAADPANDVIPIVDVSDTSMAASGTTKKISVNNILGASGTATFASATISGDLTAARLIVTGGTIPTNGLWLPTTNTLEFAANSLAQYRIAPLGVFSWFDGAGGTRMTLNSTGLGLKVIPSGWIATATPLQINSFVAAWQGSNGSSNLGFACYEGGSNTYNYRTTGDAPTFYSQLTGSHRWFSAASGTAGNAITFTQAMTLDASGNLGVGVAPSAIANVIRLEIGGALSTNLTLRSTSGNASARNWMVGANVNAFGDFVVRQSNSQGAEPNSGTDRLVIDLNGNPIFTPSSTPATLTANGQLTVNATSNTNLRFSYRGSDGTTRVANITLA